MNRSDWWVVAKAAGSILWVLLVLAVKVLLAMVLAPLWLLVLVLVNVAD